MENSESFFSNLKESTEYLFKDKATNTEEEIKIEFSPTFSFNKIITQHSVTKKYVTQLFSSLDSMSTEGENSLFNGYSYETLIDFDIETYDKEKVTIINSVINKEKVDVHNKLTYKIAPSSELFLLFLYSKMNEEKRKKFVYGLVYLSYARLVTDYDYAESKNIKDLPLNLVEFIIFLSKRIVTLHLISEESLDYSAFSKLSDAFLFNLSYNLNVPLAKKLSIDGILSHTKKLTERKLSFDEIDCPKRAYISDLVYHYETAISTENPHLQFLAFYHILEYSFEEVYDKYLIGLVKNKITDPTFSYNKAEHISELIKLIEKNLKKRDAEYNYDELESLKLTLQEYIDVEHLKTQITQYDSSLIGYYKQPVPFLGKYIIDFNSSPKDIITKIADRIYKVRNSVVHSKKGNKFICMPFKHDTQLKMELPLIKFIAEEIIIKSSKLIDIST